MSHNDNSLLGDNKQLMCESLYQADVGGDRNEMQQATEDQALDSMEDRLSTNGPSNSQQVIQPPSTSNHLKTVANLTASMGVDLLQGNQVASKIPSDFFQKQS